MLKIQTRISVDKQLAIYSARKVDPFSIGLISILNKSLYTYDERRPEPGKARWRITANKEPFDLHKLIDDFCNWYDGVLESKGCHLTTRIGSTLPRFFHGDLLMLGFLLWDIASHSQMYLGSGDVVLEVDSERFKDNWCSISFSFSVPGFGIPRKKEKSLFLPVNSKRKRRIDKHASSNLYYAGIIARLFGGTIHVRNSIGFGVEYITEICLLNSSD